MSEATPNPQLKRTCLRQAASQPRLALSMQRTALSAAAEVKR